MEDLSSLKSTISDILLFIKKYNNCMYEERDYRIRKFLFTLREIDFRYKEAFFFSLRVNILLNNFSLFSYKRFLNKCPMI